MFFKLGKSKEIQMVLRVVFIYVLFLSKKIFSQHEIKFKNTKFLAFKIYPWGFIIPHSKELINVSRSNPFGFEIDYGWLQDESQRVIKNGIYAKRGFSLFYVNYDEPRTLGYSVNCNAFIEPIFFPGFKIKLSLPTAFGISYLSKVYDKNFNPTNLFFSSHISFLLYTGIQCNIRFFTVWNVIMGLRYNHISNGGIKKPNKGMNFPMVTIGLNRYLSQPNYKKLISGDSILNYRFNKKNRYAIFISNSFKNTPEDDQFKTRPEVILGMNYDIKRIYSRYMSLCLTHEFIYDGYLQEMLQRKSIFKKAFINAVAVGNEFLFGKMSFTTFLGIYTYHPYREHDLIYQRYALFYHYKKVILGATLRAHRHVAEVIEWRLGINLF